MLVVVSAELPREGLEVGEILEEIRELVDGRLSTETVDIDYVWGRLTVRSRQINGEM